MEPKFETEIKGIVSGKLSENEIEQLTFFFKQAVSHALDQDDDDFYKSMTSEMTGNVKDLALVLVDFRKDFKLKIRPHIEDIAIKYIPQTADQLEGIIETTEQAANTIMDNLDRMGLLLGENKKFYSALKKGNIYVPDSSGEEKMHLNEDIMAQLMPAVASMESNIEENVALISDTFTQMSFQDLTGQRLQKIITLVSEIEKKITNMMISFGLKLKVKEENPTISSDELQKMVDEKAQALAGPQKQGGGLDQCNIDDLLDDLF